MQVVKRSFTPSASGSPVLPVYSSRLRSDGTVEVYVSGERNIQSEIQSHADSVDINNILRRYQLGDESVLSKTQGVYGDFLGSPKTYAEVLQQVIDARAVFESLPLERRQAFGDDFNRFFASTGSPEWYAALGFVASSEVPSEPAPETPSDESR